MDKPFLLERYFAKYEFSAPYLLSSSDCEPISVRELKEFLREARSEDEENLKLIDEYDNHFLGYTESQGNPRLRKLIASTFHDEKVITADDILIGSPEELILISMNSILKKGDEVITCFPAYQSLYTIASTIGCKLIKWEMDSETWEFDVNKLLGMITPQTKLVVMNFPHNPSGAFLPKKDVLRLIKKLEENGTYLFNDEMYRLLDISGKSFSSLSDLYPNAISLFGLSKSFSCPGVRIGWLSTQNNQLLKKCMEYKDFTTICSSSASEILAMMAIKVHKRLLERNIQLIRKNSEIAKPFFKEYEDVFPRAKLPIFGSMGMVEVKTESMDEFAMGLIDKKGLMVLPMTVFEYSEKPMFRVGYGRKNFPKVLGLLKEYVDENMRN